MDRSRRLSIGDAIEPFYGAAAGNRLTALLKEHITGAVAALQAAKSGDRAAILTASTAWYANGRQIADFLQSANPHDWSTAEMRSMMKTHLDQTLKEATDHLQGRYEADVRDYDAIHRHILAMADELSAGSCASSRRGSDRRCGRVAVFLPPTRRRPVAMGSSDAVRGRLDHWQRRHASVAFAVAVVRKFADDRASSFAGLIAYYAFFAIFPLMLVFVSVLGFVLQGNPSLREDIVDSTLARIPVLGAQIGDDVQPLTGSGVALAVGLVGALWSGLGVTIALGRALDAIWDVPRLAQRIGLAARSRGLAVLAVLGLGLIGSTVLTHVATGLAHRSTGEDVAAGLVALLVNGAALLIVFGLLTDRPLRPRELLPGVALAAVGSLVLQAAGSWYVELTVSNASATYGAFALVIGLLSWFWLGAHLLLIAAEVNVVRHRRLWPRALDGTLTRADRMVLSSAAQATRSDRREEIDVRFVERDG